MMEEQHRKQQQDELAILMRKQLEEQLVHMITRINEMHEICINLGRYTYMYEPFIDIEVTTDGKQIPKLCCKAYPDRGKEFFNNLTQDQFEDVYFMMQEKWNDFQYDEESKSGLGLAPELEADDNEGQIFGLQVRHDWNLIGNVYIFCDSLANLFETVNDESVIISSRGEQKGQLKYTLIPCLYDDDGDEMPLLDYDHVNALIGRTLNVKFQIHSA